MPIGFKVVDNANNLLVDEQGLVLVTKKLVDVSLSNSTFTIQEQSNAGLVPSSSGTFTISRATRVLTIGMVGFFSAGYQAGPNHQNDSYYATMSYLGYPPDQPSKFFVQMNSLGVLGGYNTGIWSGGTVIRTDILAAGTYTVGLKMWTDGYPQSCTIDTYWAQCWIVGGQ